MSKSALPLNIQQKKELGYPKPGKFLNKKRLGKKLMSRKMAVREKIFRTDGRDIPPLWQQNYLYS